GHRGHRLTWAPTTHVERQTHRQQSHHRQGNEGKHRCTHPRHRSRKDEQTHVSGQCHHRQHHHLGATRDEPDTYVLSHRVQHPPPAGATSTAETQPHRAHDKGRDDHTHRDRDRPQPRSQKGGGQR